MINLIKADLYKETKKRSFIVICLLIIIVSSIYLIITNNNIDLNKEYYILNPKLPKNEYYQIYKYGNYNTYEKQYETYKKQVLLENEIVNLNTISKAKKLIINITSLLYLLGIIMIFKSFHSLSYDFQTKSIRYVFLSSHKRTTILISKIISLILQMIFYILLILITILITTYLLTHENIFNLTELFIYEEELIKVPFIIFILYKCLIFMMPVIFMISLTLFLCTIFKGNSITLIINMIIYLLGITLTNLAITNNIQIVKYTFLPYLDYTYFNDGISVTLQNIIYNTNFSYFNGTIILYIYSVIFIILNSLFIKKDI